LRVNDSLHEQKYKYFADACDITPVFESDSVIELSAMTWAPPT